MDKETEKRIIGELEKTGMPLELEVAEMLKSRGWKIELGAYYLDDATKENREIDIIARKLIDFDCFTGGMPHFGFLTISLVIECKSTKKGRDWVFLTFGDTKVNPHNIKASSNLPIFDGRGHDGWTGYWLLDKIGKYNHHSDGCKVGLAHHVMHNAATDNKPENEKKDTIFTAVMQVIKASTYKLFEDLDFDPRFLLLFGRSKKIPAIDILYPIVIFDGHIYSVRSKLGHLESPNEEGHVKVLKNYVPLSFKSKKHRGNIGETYIVDIFSKKVFEQYLDRIDLDIKKVEKDVSADVKKYLQEKSNPLVAFLNNHHRLRLYFDRFKKYKK